MNQIWILHPVLTPLTLLLFVQLAWPRENGLATFGRGLAALVRTRGGRLTVLVGTVVLGVNGLQCAFDPALSEWLGYDLTAAVYALEGDLVLRIQELTPAFLTDFFSWIYLNGYVAFLFLPLICFHRTGERRGAAGHLVGFAFNYFLALPFYLLLPVQEVAWSGLTETVALMEETWPTMSEQIRLGSALDNCLPSLHVSCSTTALWFAMRYGDRGLRRLAPILWALITWSVMALAIHWGLDILTGILHGLACAWIGERLAPGALRRFMPQVS